LYDFITVTNNGKYYGIVTVKELLEKTMEIEVNVAKHMNPLTELPGNVLIEQRLQLCIETPDGYGVLYIDLDNFKPYNDVYGFEKGDQVLTHLADLLRGIVSPTDFIGHIGGDDFITKPYNTQILLARIKSLLKRTYPSDGITDIIEHNGARINILSSTVEHNGKVIELTKNELKILHYLLNNNGKIVSRVDIMEYLWDSSMFVNDNTLTVNIGRIRSKFEELGLKDYIKTKRGQGYLV